MYRFVAALIAATAVMLGMSLAAAQDDTSQPGLGGAGSISGSVSFEDGSPAARRIVEWRPAGDPDGGSTAVTDEKGQYAIEGLKPGTYYVGFFDASRVPAARNSGITSIDEAFSPELAAQGPPVGKAIRLKDAEVVQGVDFVITNIGDESVEGPETSAGDIADFPQAGVRNRAATGDEESGGATIWLLVSVAGVALAVVGVGAVAMQMRRRAP